MPNESITIRDMRPGEEKSLLRAARLAFVHSPMEQLGISKPTMALVAERDGQLAGAMFLRTFASGGARMGYLDVGFVVKAHRGQGIGGVLYPAAMARLRDMGCDPIGAMVIDDNVASWKSLANQGFGAPTMTEMARALGWGRALLLWIQTMFCVATGTRFWMSGMGRERGSLAEMFAFLWVNLALFLPGWLRYVGQPDRFANTLLAFATVLVAGALAGGIGCLAAGGGWRFGFPRGGAALSLFLNGAGSVFPMVGRWYPVAPKATPECRREMGVQATVEWAGMLGLFALGAFAWAGSAYWHGCATLAANLLVYRMIPFMPFGAFGGARVWGWNRAVFVVLAAASAVALYGAMR